LDRGVLVPHRAPNGVIYATVGLFYFRPSYDGLGLREQDGNRNSTLYTLFPVLFPVITDAVIENQFAMGAAYTCVGVISLVAAFGFRNLEADSTLLTQLLQVALQDKVQKAQMVAVLTGFMGAVGTIVAAVLFQQKIPTPIEYGTYFLSIITTLSSSSTRIRRTR